MNEYSDNLFLKRMTRTWEDIGSLQARVERLEKEMKSKKGQEEGKKFFICLPRVEC
jgi:hypothetical protein